MTYLADYERYIFILFSASKFTYTLFLFAATTAQPPMNKAIRDMSASVQVKVCIRGSSSLLVVKSVIMNKIRKRYFIVNNLIYSDILSV